MKEMNEKLELLKLTEKKALKSKKFIAFFFVEMLLFAMAMYALFTQSPLGWPLSAFMIGIVITMGTVAFVFNGYQAKLDMYLRTMALGKKIKNENDDA